MGIKMTQSEAIQIQKVRTSPNPKPDKTPQFRIRNSNDPLLRQEVELLLSKVTDLEDYTLLLFGFSAGVRVGELMFDYTAANWSEGYINIHDKKKGRYRRIYVPENVLAALNRYWQERKNLKAPKFFDFSTKTAERKIQFWTRSVLGKVKSWHCVRHTYITLSFEASIPISVVIENTGDRPATILQYYTKLSPNFIKTEVNSKPIFKVL